ncbi:MAG: 50S ribosomal protein L24 [Candidatus Colwellbacteria bacterium]|nr:50S ribosomal protein L24 [Candidatus Colwellbacteria bacterium]MBI3273980.1 50S ribosomal protein L24 [Candidatus Colwellbacteria bacterium]
MKIKKGDKVLVTVGKDRGKSGKVLHAAERDHKVVVEGLNLVKKNVRPKKQGEKGQIISTPSFISASNVQLICESCGKPSKVGYRLKGSKKERYCKKCKATN